MGLCAPFTPIGNQSLPQLRRSEADKLAAWNHKTKPIKDKDSKLYRRDPCGNTIYWHSYGRQTDMGWEVGHILAVKNGGSNEHSNLQAEHWHLNRSRGSKHGDWCPKPK